MPDLAGQVLDRKLALARVGGDEELLRELAGLFLDEYPHMLDDIRSALKRGDAYSVERAAHGLKGCVASIGGVAAMDLARDVEMLGRAQKLAEANQAMQALDLALLALRTELSSL